MRVLLFIQNIRKEKPMENIENSLANKDYIFMHINQFAVYFETIRHKDFQNELIKYIF